MRLSQNSWARPDRSTMAWQSRSKIPLPPFTKGGTAVTAPFGKRGVGGFPAGTNQRGTILLEFVVVRHSPMYLPGWLAARHKAHYERRNDEPVSIDHDKCKRDGLCVQECPMRLIEIKGEDYPAPIKSAEEFCVNCGHCVAVCPQGALSLATMKPEDCPPVKPEMQLTPSTPSIFCVPGARSGTTKAKPWIEQLLAGSSKWPVTPLPATICSPFTGWQLMTPLKYTVWRDWSSTSCA